MKKVFSSSSLLFLNLNRFITFALICGRMCNFFRSLFSKQILLVGICGQQSMTDLCCHLGWLSDTFASPVIPFVFVFLKEKQID